MIARVLVVCLALGAVASCGKKSTAETPAETAIKKLVGFRDQACACTDLRCIGQAQKQQADWLQKEMTTLGQIKFTPAQDAAGEQASKDMAACIDKIHKAAATPPPAAPTAPVADPAPPAAVPAPPAAVPAPATP